MNQLQQASLHDLEQFSMFEGLAESLMNQILEHSRLVELSRGQALFRQGETARNTYYCISGQLKISRSTRYGTEKIVEIASPGDNLIGAMLFNRQRRYSLDCRAIKASRVLSVDSTELFKLLSLSQPAYMNIVQELSDRFEALIDHVELLSVDKAKFRVAYYLLDQYKKNGRQDLFLLDSSKKNIASYLSVQPETLSRCLRSFKQSGIADSHSRKVKILDAARLENMANGFDCAA
ncbi:MAG: Crp/Fnr family transcriptional regulator [Wenzhouxiangellaceae bacterium]|nr:Crp/Fnr family transcriptional regulator [Wenzhouxiangellaceae bacterium]